MNFEQYQEKTLADLPDGYPYFAGETNDTVTYFVRRGNIAQKIVYHKTVAAVMAANAEEAKNFNRTGRLSVNTKVSAMPTSVFLDLYTKGIAQDENEFKKYLNDSDNAGFRTNNLRV